MNADARLPIRQVSCNNVQDLCIALCCIVKSRDISEGHLSPVEGEPIREFDLGYTRLRARSGPSIRTSCEIDKLEASQVSFRVLSRRALRLQLFFRFLARP